MVSFVLALDNMHNYNCSGVILPLSTPRKVCIGYIFHGAFLLAERPLKSA